MYSCALMKEQRQQVGAPLQAAPYLIHGAMRNEQAGTASNICQQTTMSSGAHPRQGAHFTLHHGAYSNRQMSNQQASAGPHQDISSQQTTGRKNNKSSLRALLTDRPTKKVSTNTQNRNPCLPGTYGFHENYDYLNRDLTKPVSAYNATATAVPHEWTACGSMLALAALHNTHTARNQIHKQNSTQHGFFPSIPPPNYYMAASQSFRNNSSAVHSLSGQIMAVSNIKQKTQPYPAQLDSTHYNGRAAANSINSNLNNQYEIFHYLPKPDELPLNPSSTQQQMPSHTSTIDSLCMSSTAGSNGHPPVYTSPSYRRQQFVSEARRTLSNTNTQPVTSAVSESNNFNTTPSSPLCSGWPLPQTQKVKNVLSRSQDTTNVSPQPSSVPNTVSVMATGDGRGMTKMDNAFLLNNHKVSEGNLNGSLSDLSQLLQISESISPQKNNSQLSAANDSEILDIIEFLTSVKPNDNSLHSSPGRPGTKAVAVVQPLSLESCHFASKPFSSYATVDEVLSHPDKISLAVAKNGEAMHLGEASNVYLENPNQTRSNKSIINLSSQSNDGTVLSASKPGPQNSTKISKLDINVEPAPRKSVPPEEPATQNSPEGQREMKMATNSPVFEFPSLPTTPQTAVTTTALITDAEKAQAKPENLTEQFILKDDEVYSERPYKSSWLNVNEHLDDIDKEFGFPWTLRHRFCKLESDSQADEITVDRAPVFSGVPDKVLSQTQLRPFESGEDKDASSVEAPSAQTGFLNETESDNSSDLYHSFKIEVLSPQEAKRIFEQAHSEMLQSRDKDEKQAENVSSNLEIESGEDNNAIPSESKLGSSVKQACCTARLMEMQSGSPLSKCQCKKDQNHEDDTDKTRDKVEKTIQKDDNLCEINSDRTFSPALERQNSTRGKAKTQNCIMTFSCPELSNDVTEILDLTDTSQSNVPVISDKENEGLSRVENEIPNQRPDLDTIMLEAGEECVQEQLKSTGPMQLSSPDSSNKQIESEISLQKSDYDKGSGQTQLKSADVRELSLETEGSLSAKATLQTASSSRVKHETVERKWKKQSSDESSPFGKKLKKHKQSVALDSQLALEGVSKHEKNCSDATDDQPSASNGKIVKLVLFGSTQQKSASFGDRKSHVTQHVSDRAQKPPKVLSLPLSPVRTKSREAVYMEKYSVKQLIHEKWRRSFLPTKIRPRSKLLTEKYSSASLSGGSPKKEKQPVSSELNVLDGKNKCNLSLKKRRLLSNKLRHENEMRKKYFVTVKWPTDTQRRNSKSGNHDVLSPQEKIVLKFSVLPDTFKLNHESSEGKETPDDDSAERGLFSHQPNLAKEKDRSSSEAVTKAKGMWSGNPEKKYGPLHLPPVHMMSSAFLDFQKKYRKKTEPSTDK